MPSSRYEKKKYIFLNFLKTYYHNKNTLKIDNQDIFMMQNMIHILSFVKQT